MNTESSKAPEKWIEVDTKKFVLYFHEGFTVKARFTIGIGKETSPTPTGYYYIYALQENPKIAMRQNDPTMPPPEAYGTRNIDLSVQSFDFEAWCWRNYAIHGTNNNEQIGNRTSHGCIIMRNEDIEELYPLVSVGTLVIIW